MYVYMFTYVWVFNIYINMYVYIHIGIYVYACKHICNMEAHMESRGMQTSIQLISETLRGMLTLSLAWNGASAYEMANIRSSWCVWLRGVARLPEDDVTQKVRCYQWASFPERSCVVRLSPGYMNPWHRTWTVILVLVYSALHAVPWFQHPGFIDMPCF